jgi:nucleoside-diphosphate kinase
MQSGPVLAVVLEGVGTVAKVRSIVGATFPDQAQPGTIRGDLAHQALQSTRSSGKAIANRVHASGAPEEADYEVWLWFGEGEIFDCRRAGGDFAY